MAYVYMVRCSDDSLYTGWTTDLKKRVSKHNEGKGSKYTRARTPVKLVYFEVIEDNRNAMKREYEIKQLTKEKKEELVKIHTK